MDGISIGANLALDIKSAEKQIKSLARQVETSIGISLGFDDSEAGKIGQSISKSISDALSDIEIKPSFGGLGILTGLLTGAVSLAVAPIGAIFRGVFEKIGRNVATELGAGIEESISPLIGSFGLLGKTGGKALGEELKLSLGSNLKATQDIMQELLGTEIIAIEAGSKRFKETQLITEKLNNTVAQLNAEVGSIDLTQLRAFRDQIQGLESQTKAFGEQLQQEFQRSLSLKGADALEADIVGLNQKIQAASGELVELTKIPEQARSIGENLKIDQLDRQINQTQQKLSGALQVYRSIVDVTSVELAPAIAQFEKLSNQTNKLVFDFENIVKRVDQLDDLASITPAQLVQLDQLNLINQIEQATEELINQRQTLESKAKSASNIKNLREELDATVKIINATERRNQLLNELANSTRDVAQVQRSPQLEAIIKQVEQLTQARVPLTEPRIAQPSGNLLEQIVGTGTVATRRGETDTFILDPTVFETLTSGVGDATRAQLFDTVSIIVRELRQAQTTGGKDIEIDEAQFEAIASTLIKATSEELEIIESQIEAEAKRFKNLAPAQAKALAEDVLTFELRYAEQIAKQVGLIPESIDINKLIDGVADELKDGNKIIEAIFNEITNATGLGIDQIRAIAPSIVLPETERLASLVAAKAAASFDETLNAIFVRPGLYEDLKQNTVSRLQLGIVAQNIVNALRISLSEVGTVAVEQLVDSVQSQIQPASRAVRQTPKPTTSEPIKQISQKTQQIDSSTDETLKGSATETLKAIELYNTIARQAIEASGINFEDVAPLLPSLRSKTEFEEVETGGSAAQFDTQFNEIVLARKLYQQLINESVDIKLVEAVIHEIRHALQTGFGAVGITEASQGAGLIQDTLSLEALQLTTDVFDSLNKKLQGSIASASAQGADPAVVKILEDDAYAFQEQFGQQILEATRRRVEELKRQATTVVPPTNASDLTSDIQKAQATYELIARQVLESSGLNFEDLKAILPDIKSRDFDSEGNEGAKGAYNRVENTLFLARQLYEQLIGQTLDLELVDTIVHELRHAIQTSFGTETFADAAQQASLIPKLLTLEVGRFSEEILESLKEQVLGSVDFALSQKSDPEVARVVEEDAYTFAQLYSQTILDATRDTIEKLQKQAKNVQVEQTPPPTPLPPLTTQDVTQTFTESIQETQKTIDLYNIVARQVVEASGLNFEELKGFLPTLRAATEKEQKSGELQSIGAAFNQVKNEIVVAKELYEKLLENVVSREAVGVLIHEIRHALQTNFGKVGAKGAASGLGLIGDLLSVELTQASEKVIQGALSAIERSVMFASKQGIDAGAARILENDAYAFQIQYTKKIFEATSQIIDELKNQVAPVEIDRGAIASEYVRQFESLGEVDVKKLFFDSSKGARDQTFSVEGLRSVVRDLGVSASIYKSATKEDLAKILTDQIASGRGIEIAQILAKYGDEIKNLKARTGVPQTSGTVSTDAARAKIEQIKTASRELIAQLQGLDDVGEENLEQSRKQFLIKIGKLQQVIANLESDADLSGTQRQQLGGLKSVLTQQFQALAQALDIESEEIIKERLKNLEAQFLGQLAQIESIKLAQIGDDEQVDITKLEKEIKELQAKVSRQILSNISVNVTNKIDEILTKTANFASSVQDEFTQATLSEEKTVRDDAEKIARSIDAIAPIVAEQVEKVIDATRNLVQDVEDEFKKATLDEPIDPTAQITVLVNQIEGAFDNLEGQIEEVIREADIEAENIAPSNEIQSTLQLLVNQVNQEIDSLEQELSQSQSIETEPIKQNVTELKNQVVAEVNEQIKQLESEINIASDGDTQTSIDKITQRINTELEEFKNRVLQGQLGTLPPEYEQLLKQIQQTQNTFEDAAQQILQRERAAREQLIDTTNQQLEQGLSDTNTQNLLSRLKGLAGQYYSNIKGANAFQKTLSLLNSTLGRIAISAASFIALQTGFDTLVNVAQFIKETTLKLEEMQTALNFVSGGVEKGAANFEFLSQQARDLKIALFPAIEGYNQLAAATRDTPIEKDTQDIAQGLLQAGRAYNLTTERLNNANLAFSQIAGKAVVSQEELRGQLSEALPGATQIAARALGVTTAELNALVEAGLTAEEFLPRFGRQLQRETAFAAAAASGTLSAAVTDLDNARIELVASVGKVLTPATTEVYQGLAGALRAIAVVTPGLAETAITLAKIGATYAAINLLSFSLKTIPAQIAAINLTNLSTGIASATGAITKFFFTTTIGFQASALASGLLVAGLLDVAFAAQKASSSTKFELDEIEKSFEKAARAFGQEKTTEEVKAQSQKRQQIFRDEQGALVRLLSAINPKRDITDALTSLAIESQGRLLSSANSRLIQSQTILANIKNGANVTSDAVNEQINGLSNLKGALENEQFLTESDIKLKEQNITAINKLITNLQAEADKLDGVSTNYAKLNTVRKNSITQATKIETQALEQITQAELDGVTLKEDLEVAKLRATKARIDAEIAAQQAFIQSVKDNSSIKDQKKVKEDYAKAQDDILKLRKETSAKTIEIIKAEREAIVAEIESEATAASRVIETASQERAIALQELINKRAISAEEVSKIELENQRKNTQERLAAISEEISALDNAEITEAEKEERLSELRGERNDLILESLKQEVDAEKKAQDAIVSKIKKTNEVARERLAVEKETLQFQESKVTATTSEIEAIQQVVASREREKELLEAQSGLLQSRNNLRSTTADLELERYRRALEIVRTIASDEVKSDGELRALKQELASLGIQGRLTESALAQKIAQLEGRAAAAKREALLSEQEQQRKSLELEIAITNEKLKQAKLESEQALQSAKINAQIKQNEAASSVIDAKEKLLDAQSKLFTAGSPEEKSQAQELVKLQEQRLQLALEQQKNAAQLGQFEIDKASAGVDLANQNIANSEKLNAIKREQLDIEQKIATQQQQQADSTKVQGARRDAAVAKDESQKGFRTDSVTERRRQEQLDEARKLPDKERSTKEAELKTQFKEEDKSAITDTINRRTRLQGLNFGISPVLPSPDLSLQLKEDTFKSISSLVGHKLDAITSLLSNIKPNVNATFNNTFAERDERQLLSRVRSQTLDDINNIFSNANLQF